MSAFALLIPPAGFHTTTFAGLQNALLPYDLSHIRSFGYMFEPRYIFRAGRLDQ